MNTYRFLQYIRWMFACHKRIFILFTLVIAGLALCTGFIHSSRPPISPFDRMNLYLWGGILGCFLVGNHWKDLRKSNPKTETFLLVPVSHAEKILELFLFCFVGFGITIFVAAEGGYAIGWNLSRFIPNEILQRPPYPYPIFQYSTFISSWLLWAICAVGVFYFKKHSSLKTILVTAGCVLLGFIMEAIVFFSATEYFSEIYEWNDYASGISEDVLGMTQSFSHQYAINGNMNITINLILTGLFLFFMTLGFFKLKEKEFGR